MVKPKKQNPTWSDIKARLSNFDHAGMMALVQDMYALNKENKAFLHARFGIGTDVLGPYKESISRWLWPDIVKNQNTSVSKARKAIADYKKAIGRVEDLAELMTYYCEQAVGFGTETFPDDVRYFDSLVRMYGQALRISVNLTPDQRADILHRLEKVKKQSEIMGYGVGNELAYLIADYLIDE